MPWWLWLLILMGAFLLILALGILLGKTIKMADEGSVGSRFPEDPW